MIIRAQALTTFELTPDGAHVRFNVRDDEGLASALEMPASCLHQLLMTLPHIIQQALRRNRQDDSLRLVYPLGEFRLELGEVDEQGKPRYILTLQTAGPFEISFAATPAQLDSVAQSVIDQVVDAGQRVARPATLNS